MNNVFDIGSFAAGEDLSSYQFCPVGISATDGLIYLADGDETIAMGILQNKPTSGQACSIRTLGISKVKLGGTVTIGAWGTASSGAVIATTTAETRTLGYFCAAGVSGDIVEMKMEPGYYPGSAT